MNEKKDSYRSLSVNVPNIVKRIEWRLTNSSATPVNNISSTIAWFSCIGERALNLF